ncbi:MAG: hypothetical protein HY748_04830 [Elusimicrobia bacterium]|nr:hypothetical protein [Elusimicrobiota bacterium]
MGSPGETAARLVFPGFTLGVDDPDDAMRLVDLGVGGFCVYHGTPAEVAEFSRKAVQRAARPLLLCADYEDGLASHVAGGTAFPSNMGLAASGDDALAFEKGRVTGLEARALGVGWVLAPVVDLATRPDNPIVNVRSFGSDPGRVSRMARAFIKGLASGGVLSCIKHFPGHGETGLDSHLGLPTVALGREVLDGRELAPYRDLKEDADAVMIGHLAVPALSGGREVPATLCPEIISGELRGLIGFKGLVVSDALSMHAVAKRFPEAVAAETALVSGCDILLAPGDPRRLVYDLMRRADEAPAVAAAAAAAAARLDAALRTLAGRGAAGGAVDAGVVGCAAHAGVSARLALRCLAWHRPLARPLPRAIAYFEPDEGFPDWVQGAAFLDEIKALGFTVSLTASAAEAEFVVAGLFVSPRAYAGRIRYGEEERRRLTDAWALARAGAAVSFGSPWLLEDAPDVAACLAAFSASKDAQRAAARALAGRLAVTGKMPVTLRR